LWDQYEDVEIQMPKVTIPQEEQDTHSKRLLKCIDLWDNPVPEEAIRRARRAYYAACTYVDNQIGRLLTVLKNCGLAKNTIVMFSGDHGDMLGERGLWYKMSWFENSARVPLIINYPQRYAPHRVKESVSTLDLLPTLVDMIGGNREDLLPMDGKSLYPALLGMPGNDEVFGEYMGEGTISPVVMIRRGRYKYISSLVDAPQLFDFENDPLELSDLTEDPDHKIIAAKFAVEVTQKWDLPKIHQQVLKSQRERRICWQALQQGKWEPWDYQPTDDATKK
jgi:choline-sulfatase